MRGDESLTWKLGIRRHYLAKLAAQEAEEEEESF